MAKNFHSTKNPSLSLFAQLRIYFGNRLELLDCTKATLVHLSHTIEDLILRERIPAVLLTGFQESSHWRRETERYAALSTVARQVCIFAGGISEPDSNERQVHIPLRGDDPLRQEWFLCVLSSQFSVVLCGQDYHTNADNEALRQFATFWSFEPQIVNETLDVLEQTIAEYRPDRLHAFQQARIDMPPTAPNARLMTHFTHELIRYEESLQASMRERETRFKTISELTTDYIYSLSVLPDLSVKTDWTTDAFVQITGYSVAELDAHGGWAALIHQEDLPSAAERARILFGGNEDVRDLRIVTRSGEVRWLRDYARPVLDPVTGQVVAILGAACDITIRKRQEEERQTIQRQLQQTQKLESLGVLAGGIAHDFNNLLVAILGNASLALQDIDATSPAHLSLIQIELAAQRAADLTRQLLAYAGKGRFVVEPLDMNQVINDMLHLLQSVIPKHVSLQVALAPQLSPVIADTTQMQQVLMNLVVNAAEATPHTGGNVRISTSEVDGSSPYVSQAHLIPPDAVTRYVCIEVRDNGEGMDAATIARIFEPFFTTKFTGRGLGLSAVLGIMRGHNGAVGIESVPGFGSVFRILLPVAVSSSFATKNNTLNKAPASWHATGHILVIDDEAEVRTVTGRMIKRFGFLPLLAENGAHGLTVAAAHNGNLSVALIDMTMPHMDGRETFGRLRAMLPDLPVLLISGYNEQSVTDLLAGQHRVKFLQKPFTAAELLARIRVLVEH